MSRQKTSKNPLTWLSLDKEGRMSRHTGSFRTFFEAEHDENEDMTENASRDEEADIHDEENTTEKANQLREEVRIRDLFGIPHDPLLLLREDVPRMAHVVYGSHMEEAAAFPEQQQQQVGELSGERPGRDRKGTGRRSLSQGRKMRTPRKIDGQRLTPRFPKASRAGPSLKERVHVSATFDAGTSEGKDYETGGTETSRSDSLSASEERLSWRCEACGVERCKACGIERSVFIQDLEQRRAAASLAVGQMGERTDGELQNPFEAPRPGAR